RHAGSFGRVVKAESKTALATRSSIVAGRVAQYAKHVYARATIMDELVVLGPMHLGHNVASLVMLGQRHEPIGAVAAGADEEQGVVGRAARFPQVAVEAALDVQPEIRLV